MIKVMFICLGNICRSPMAEFILKDMVQKQGLQDKFYICSSATSNEEVGNPVHHGTKTKLATVNISCASKTAVQLKSSDYADYDYFLCMENQNKKNAIRIFNNNDCDNKVFCLLDFCQTKKDIADPWYTGNFDVTYNDILNGCNCFLNELKERNLL